MAKTRKKKRRQGSAKTGTNKTASATVQAQTWTTEGVQKPKAQKQDERSAGTEHPPGFEGVTYLPVQRRRSVLFASKSKRAGVGSDSAEQPGHEWDDPFTKYYKDNTDLQEPLIPFSWAWRQYYQCDTLQIAADATMDNVVNPHQFMFHGDKGERDSAENKLIEVTLRDFFSRVNERQSWRRIAKKIVRSLFVVNCAFVEVIRGITLERDPGNRGYRIGSNPPERLYYLPSPHMRATLLDDDPQEVEYQIPRRGKMVKIKIPRRFRKFARVDPMNNASLLWFKELGDTRRLDSVTGEWLGSNETPKNPLATEVWFWRKHTEGEVYGVPDWFAVLWDIKGRSEAKWLNFDHLEQGAIPPGMLAISGGEPSEKTKEELDTLLENIRQPEMLNRLFWFVVQAQSDMNLDSAEKIPKIQYIKLRDPQHEDYYYAKYLVSTEEAIRRISHLPPILTGVVDSTTFASAYTSMEVAESQVFQPIRDDMDEKVTIDLIQNEFGFYNWSIEIGGSRIGDKETFYRAIGALQRAGALTINNVRELSNQLLGTNFPPFEGELYNEPITVVMALANAGQVSFNGDSAALEFVTVVAETTQQMASTLEKMASAEIEEKAVKKIIAEQTSELVRQLTQHAEVVAEYEAPDDDEQNFELMPTGTDDSQDAANE